MIEKIKAFCKNRVVRIIALIMFAISTAVLVMGGIKVADLNNVTKLVVGVLSAIGLLIAAIGALIESKENSAGK